MNETPQQTRRMLMEATMEALLEHSGKCLDNNHERAVVADAVVEKIFERVEQSRLRSR